MMKVELALLSTLLASTYAQVVVPVPQGVIPPGVVPPGVVPIPPGQPQPAVPPVSLPQNQAQPASGQPAQGSPEWFRVAMANSQQPTTTSPVPTGPSRPNDASKSRCFVLLSVFSAAIPVLFL